MQREDARQEIRRNWKRLFPADRKNKGIICPLCNSGSGEHGTGITENPRKPGQLKCWNCGFQGDVIDLIQQARGTDYNTALKEAAAEFIPSAEENGGHWKTLKKLPDSWKLRYRNLTLKAMLSNSKQLGVFPEQACQWDWLMERVRNYGKPMKVLNLFGYTGAATMACAAAGAKVTHLDASKKAVAWAKENQELSKVPLDRIRWILDDALKFVQREARRGSLYEGVILDPPKFGRGPKGEVWEFYKGFPALLEACAGVLSNQADFMLVTAYAVKASSVTLYNALSEVNRKRNGTVSVGEVCNCDKAGRLLL